MTKKPLISKKEAEALAQEHSTPLYVYRRSMVEANYRRLVRAIPYEKKAIYFAMKANANPELLKTLLHAGGNVETVSEGEVKQARKAGFPANRISFTCSNIAKAELLRMKKLGVKIHLDSLNQLQWIGEAFPGATVSIRINQGFGAGHHSHVITGGPESKFGIYHTDIDEALRIAKKYDLRVTGIQQHIGSNILEPATFIKAMKLLLASARRFPDLESIDFGGGFGIPYRPETKELDIEKLGTLMTSEFEKFCKSYGRPLTLCIEPGRYLVANAGALLATVTDIKKTPAHTFVGVDTGFNHLIRPAMYGSYHHIFNLSNPKGKSVKVAIAGNVCESGDVFAKGRSIPSPRIGELLLFADAGAYGYTMSSDYNARPRPKEIVL